MICKRATFHSVGLSPPICLVGLRPQSCGSLRSDVHWSILPRRQTRQTMISVNKLFKVPLRSMKSDPCQQGGKEILMAGDLRGALLPGKALSTTGQSPTLASMLKNCWQWQLLCTTHKEEENNRNIFPRLDPGG